MPSASEQHAAREEAPQGVCAEKGKLLSSSFSEECLVKWGVQVSGGGS